MRVKPIGVSISEDAGVVKLLPDVAESRSELITAIKNTQIYRQFSGKGSLTQQLHSLVSVAENRGKLYDADVEKTAAKFIQHMEKLSAIGRIINPNKGHQTGRQSVIPSTKSKNDYVLNHWFRL